MGCQTPNANQAPPRVHMAMVIRLVVDNMLRNYPIQFGIVKLTCGNSCPGRYKWGQKIRPPERDGGRFLTLCGGYRNVQL